jgi:peptidoglycan/xylan/chitin deacetylase (PgdA/CDA1 family)
VALLLLESVFSALAQTNSEKPSILNILLTLDYELYFGESGTAEKCILQPTEALRAISKKYNAPMTYFVDAGYLWRLQESISEFPELQKEQNKIHLQLNNLVAEGNEIALHIHPHWEDSFYTKSGWKMDVSRYKLDDFSEEEIDGIFERYKSCLEGVINKKITVYRAGGWCLQPFLKVKEAFRKYGLKVDSSVFYGGFNDDNTYFYDFRNAPQKDAYHFSNDLVKEDPNGEFIEYPIASEVVHPFFFWCLFIWGRLLPKRHKGYGDGFPVSVKGFRKKVLSKKSLHCISLDGFFAKRIGAAAKRFSKLGNKHMVVIGHPKACTVYSLEQLEKFVAKNHTTYNFTTYKQLGD